MPNTAPSDQPPQSQSGLIQADVVHVGRCAVWRDDGLHTSGWCNDRGALLSSLYPKKRSDDSCAPGQYCLNRLNHPSGKQEKDRDHEQIGACVLHLCSRDCVNGSCIFICPYPNQSLFQNGQFPINIVLIVCGAKRLGWPGCRVNMPFTPVYSGVIIISKQGG